MKSKLRYGGNTTGVTVSRKTAEVELVLLPAFRGEFRSSVQRQALVHLHDFQCFHNCYVQGLPK